MSSPVLALRRLRAETMDWCRAVENQHSGPLSAHEDTIQNDPAVWE